VLYDAPWLLAPAAAIAVVVLALQLVSEDLPPPSAIHANKSF